MTIRTRLAAAIGLTATVVIALSVVAVRSASEERRVVHEPALHFRRFSDMNAFGLAVTRVMKEIADIGGGRADQDELAEALRDARERLAILEAGAAHKCDAAYDETAASFRATFERIEQAQVAIAALLAAGDRDAAEEAIERLGEHEYERDFLRGLERATTHEHDHMAAIVASVERSATRTRRTAITLASVGLVVVILAVVVVMGIQRRLGGLTRIVARMGGGDLGARTPDVDAADELGELGRTFNGMADSLGRTVAAAAEKEALAQELQLAAHMQHAILPRAIAVPGLEVAAVMNATAQIGGDYYDVLPTADGAWIGIGDVSGHGFNAGVVMIMAQSAIATCVEANPDAGPAAILEVVNRVFYENVRTRLGLREHMTLSLLRYHHDGRVVYAGAHQELLVRAPGGAVQALPTEGPWLGLVPDVRRHLVEREVTLAPGESLLLFTDGVTEARRPCGAGVGLDALTAALASAPAAAGAEPMCAAILDAVTAGETRFDDDMTLVVVHRPPVARAAA